MTHRLEAAFEEAKKLSEAEQQQLAEVILAAMRDLEEPLAESFTRLSEKAFEADWDNEKDAAYDDWKKRYAAREG